MDLGKIKEQLPQDVREIVEMEYVLFDRVQNIGGRADCQDNRPTFFIMRGSQLCAWNEEMRQSYRQDLEEAMAAGRNPLAEKYGYMMERTNPAEYAQIADRLPVRSPEKKALVEGISRLQVAWQEELAEEFPVLTGHGRATRSSEDRTRATSFETYLQGELSTYSMRTLRLYEAHAKALREAGANMNRLILQKEVELYGYESLAAAERAHEGR